MPLVPSTDLLYHQVHLSPNYSTIGSESSQLHSSSQNCPPAMGSHPTRKCLGVEVPLSSPKGQPLPGDLLIWRQTIWPSCFRVGYLSSAIHTPRAACEEAEARLQLKTTSLPQPSPDSFVSLQVSPKSLSGWT